MRSRLIQRMRKKKRIRLTCSGWARVLSRERCDQREIGLRIGSRVRIGVAHQPLRHERMLQPAHPRDRPDHGELGHPNPQPAGD